MHGKLLSLVISKEENTKDFIVKWVLPTVSKTKAY